MTRAGFRRSLLLLIVGALCACSSRYFEVDQIASVEAGVSSEDVRGLIQRPSLESCSLVIDGQPYWVDTFYMFVGNRSPYDLPATERRRYRPIDWPYHFLFQADSLAFWGFAPTFTATGNPTLTAAMDSCYWEDPLTPFRFADDLAVGQTRDTAEDIVFGWHLATFVIDDIPDRPPLTVSAYNLYRGRNVTYLLIFGDAELRYWGFLHELARSSDPTERALRDRIWARWPITYDEDQDLPESLTPEP